jgi:hypothetical protein
MRNRKLRQRQERWPTPIWSATPNALWYHVDEPQEWETDPDLVFSSRYNTWTPSERVICVLEAIFQSAGNNIKSGGVYTRPEWNSKAANDAMSGARAVVAAVLYDGLSWGRMSPHETAIEMTREIVERWQPGQSGRIMMHLKNEMGRKML